jgi:hypothetical protein
VLFSFVCYYYSQVVDGVYSLPGASLKTVRTAFYEVCNKFQTLIQVLYFVINLL